VGISAWSEGTVVPILVFHAVDEDASEYSVAPHKFEHHMQWLSRVATPIDLDTLGQVLRRDVTVRRPVVITFDDGYASVFTAAYPVLRSLEIPFCVFLATAFVGEERPKPMLTWDQIQAMRDSRLMTIGSHAHTHHPLKDMDREAARWELDQSTAELRKRLGVEVRYFAFPHGKHDAVSLGEAHARFELVIGREGLQQVGRPLDRPLKRITVRRRFSRLRLRASFSSTYWTAMPIVTRSRLYGTVTRTVQRARAFPRRRKPNPPSGLTIVS
jgi:peptidoglycan/xylan/chitin deacetylase (PgdA/CDA1 family)